MWAQQGLSYQQLRDMLQSSIEQGLQDREISKYLKSQKLRFALSDALYEECQGMGAEGILERNSKSNVMRIK